MVIDPLTGAMWKLETNYLSKTLQLKTASTTEPTLKLQDYNTLLEDIKTHLVRSK